MLLPRLGLVSGLGGEAGRQASRALRRLLFAGGTGCRQFAEEELFPPQASTGGIRVQGSLRPEPVFMEASMASVLGIVLWGRSLCRGSEKPL